MQQYLGTHLFEGYREDIRRRQCAALGIDGNTIEGFQGIDEIVLQRLEGCLLLLEMCAGHLGCEAEAGDARDIMGSGTHVLLLTTTIDQRAQTDLLVLIKEADPLRAMQLMTGYRHHIDMLQLRTKRDLAIGLDRIRREPGIRIALLHDTTDLLDRLDRTHLVVHRHNRHQDGIRTDRRTKIIEGNVPLLIHRKIGHFVAKLHEHIERAIDRRMLERRGDDVLSLLPLRHRRTENHSIVRLRAAGGEEDLLRLHLQGRRHLLTRMAEILLRIEALRVLRGRISVILGQGLHHQLHDLRIWLRRRGIIKINFSHVYFLSFYKKP